MKMKRRVLPAEQALKKWLDGLLMLCLPQLFILPTFIHYTSIQGILHPLFLGAGRIINFHFTIAVDRLNAIPSGNE